MTAAFDNAGNKPTLTADQEHLIYRTGRQHFLETDHITDRTERCEEVCNRSRRKLKSILGPILLAVAIQLIKWLVLKWIDKHIINPPSEPPQGFASSLEAN